LRISVGLGMGTRRDPRAVNVLLQIILTLILSETNATYLFMYT